VLGLLTPNEVRRIERERWNDVTVSEVMRPLEQLRTVTPDTSATEAFETMAREDLNQLPVIRHGHLEGFVSRGHILRLLQTRSELNG
jgi:CBS domain-containing protein